MWQDFEMGDPVRLLLVNGALQIFWSIVVGFIMLVPRQPWGRGLERLLPKARDLLSAHLDWIMLAFMQFAAALVMKHFPGTASAAAAVLLIVGGWLNPVPYLFRGFGVNAFALTGSTVQRLAAALGLGSSLALLVAWGRLVVLLFAAA